MSTDVADHAQLPGLAQRLRSDTLTRALTTTSVLVLSGVIAAADVPVVVTAFLGLFAVLLATWSPVGLMGALLVAVPWVYQPIEIGRLRFSHLELAILAGSAALGIHLAVSVARYRDLARFRYLLRPSRITIPTIMVLVTATLSLRTVADPTYLTESLREYRTVIIEPVMAFFIFRWMFTRPFAKQYAILCLLAAGSAVTVGAFNSGDLTGLREGDIRISGPYPHPNNFAFYLERLTLMGAALTAVAGRVRLWWVTLILTVTCGFGTILTMSRGALLALLVGGIFLAARTRPAYRAPVFVGVGAFATVATFAVRDRLTDTGGGGAEFTRFPIWRASIAMIRDYPRTGVGLDQFLYQYLPRYVEPAGWPERFTAHPHNLILDLWLRLGIAGPVLGLWLVAAIWSLRRQPVHELTAMARATRIAGVAALLGGMTHGMVDNGFFLPDLAVLTWFCVALIEPRVDVTC